MFTLASSSATIRFNVEGVLLVEHLLLQGGHGRRHVWLERDSHLGRCCRLALVRGSRLLLADAVLALQAPLGLLTQLRRRLRPQRLDERRRAWAATWNVVRAREIESGGECAEV